jgi:hypothetical protein
VADDQVAAGRQAVAVFGDAPVRFVLVGNEVQDAGAHQRHRLRQVEQPGNLGVLQDAGGRAQVGAYHGDSVAACQQCLAVQEDHGIDVDVDHARVRRDLLCHLVDVEPGGQAPAQVEELPDARLASEVADRPADEHPVVPDDPRYVRRGYHQLLRRRPVGGEIVLAAQQVVVDPGHVRLGRIDALCRHAPFGHLSHHSC